LVLAALCAPRETRARGHSSFSGFLEALNRGQRSGSRDRRVSPDHAVAAGAANAKGARGAASALGELKRTRAYLQVLVEELVPAEAREAALRGRLARAKARAAALK